MIQTVDPRGAFSGKAADYAKARPDYPDELISYLKRTAFLSAASTVADIGSGTGKLTAALLKTGAKVFAVEPNADMRAEAERLLGEESRFCSVPADAEHTGLDDASVDLITAAQSFHWFDAERFKTECRRILKNGGKIALIWNTEIFGGDFFNEFGELHKRFLTQEASERKPVKYRDMFFAPAEHFLTAFEKQIFKNDLYYDKETFIARALSASAAPRPADPNYAGYLDGLEILFDKYQRNGKLLYPNETTVYLGTP